MAGCFAHINVSFDPYSAVPIVCDHVTLLHADLESVDVSGNAITDAGLATLAAALQEAASSQLHHLDLSRNHICDEGAATLCGLFRHLRAARTRVAADAVAAAAAASQAAASAAAAASNSSQILSGLSLPFGWGNAGAARAAAAAAAAAGAADAAAQVALAKALGAKPLCIELCDNHYPFSMDALRGLAAAMHEANSPPCFSPTQDNGSGPEAAGVSSPREGGGGAGGHSMLMPPALAPATLPLGALPPIPADEAAEVGLAEEGGSVRPTPRTTQAARLASAELGRGSSAGLDMEVPLLEGHQLPVQATTAAGGGGSKDPEPDQALMEAAEQLRGKYSKYEPLVLLALNRLPQARHAGAAVPADAAALPYLALPGLNLPTTVSGHAHTHSHSHGHAHSHSHGHSRSQSFGRVSLSLGQGGVTAVGGGVTAAGHGRHSRSVSMATESSDGDVGCGVCFDAPNALTIRTCGHRICSECPLFAFIFVGILSQPFLVCDGLPASPPADMLICWPRSC